MFRWFSNVRMKPKLISLFLLVGIIPLAVCAWFSYNSANNSLQDAQDESGEALKKQAFNQLIALRDVKKAQIEAYFRDRIELLTDVQSNLRFTEGIPAFAEVFAEGLEGP